MYRRARVWRRPERDPEERCFRSPPEDPQISDQETAGATGEARSAGLASIGLPSVGRPRGRLDEVAGLDRQRGDGLASLNVQPNVNALEAQTKEASRAADCHRPGRTQEPCLRAEQRREDRRRTKLRNEESA